VKRQSLNGLNYYLLHFLEKISQALDQDKARNPKWHEAMIDANIDIFEMSHKESVSYF
jgi:hypothetical protein